ncbi:MAG TPA: prepilin-type N-terminal cleavage/methylation domain-containing protein [Syntrophales bacterium]|nr:prepilin-type N-terminal cleavage/methylation domain-containing protein [Syntrophales bacterium]
MKQSSKNSRIMRCRILHLAACGLWLAAFFPVPCTLYPIPFAKRAAPRHATRYPLHASSQRGFTLLEVMIAMAILATVLVTVFHSQSQSIAMANESRAMTSLALLAQSRMAEVEGQQNLSTGQTSGKFGDDFPDYSWTVGITQPPGPGSSYLRKIEVTVIHDYYPNRPYKVILYRPVTLQQ